jgi:serine/threonine-protein kinase
MRTRKLRHYTPCGECFGVAKLRDKTPADGSNLLKDKPAYMSPEQLTSAKVIDLRSDLFSIGIMLWELLAHRPPFERDNMEATCYALMSEEVPQPSEFNADMPPSLEAIAMRLLEREPKDAIRARAK